MDTYCFETQKNLGQTNREIPSAGIEPATARYLVFYSRALYQLSYEG